MPTKVHLPDGRVVNFPDGMPPDQIQAAVAKLAPPTEERTWTDTAVDALPTIGGMAGGLIGSMAGMGVGSVPLAVGGAAIGGAGGEGFRQAIQALRGKETPQGPGQALTGIGTQAAVQGGAEALGQGVGRLLSKAGGALYRKALSPTKVLRAENPHLIETGLQHAIPVSSGGLDKVSLLKNESRAAADNLVQHVASQPNAPMIDPKQAVGGITRAVEQVRDLPVARPQMQAIGDYGRAYLREHPRPLTLPQAQQSVRATDKFYNPAYRATMDRGNAVTSGNAAAALGINDETRNLLRQAVPGLQAQNANTQALAGLKEAVKQRTENVGNWSVSGMRHAINAGVSGGVGAVGGKDKGLETFAIMEALSNPHSASRLAIAADRLGAHPAASANAIRTALLALMSSHQGPTP